MKRQSNSDVRYGNFVWDADKAAANIINHEGVTFEEAATVWEDSFYVDFYDPDHSWEEHRFIAVGYVFTSTSVNCFVHR